MSVGYEGKTMHIRLAIVCILVALPLLISNGTRAETVKTTPALTIIKVERAIILANLARKKAAAVEGEWRDVRRLIIRARTALADENLELAMDLAQQAREQAELGYEQAVRQAELKIPAYLQKLN